MTDEHLIDDLRFHGRYASETQDDCSARKNKERERAADRLTALLATSAEKDAEIARLTAERDEAREGDEVATAEMQHWQGVAARTSGELDMMRADFNDCNSERARWRTRAEAAEAEAAALRERLERASQVIDKLLFLAEAEHACLVSWNGVGSVANYDDITAEARALQNKEQANG